MSIAQWRGMRTPLTPLLIALAVPAAFLLAEMVYGFRIPLLAVGGVALTPARPVALRDSLPALAGGLSDLEAFSMALSPRGRADAARTVWWAPVADSLVIEFYTERRRLDSTQLILWSDVSGYRHKNLRLMRYAKWTLPVHESVDGWEEIVGVYVSRPRSFTFRSADTTVEIFERVEGRVLHRVQGAYRTRRQNPVLPDTAYPSPQSGDLEILARGDAVAVVNPGKHEVLLGVIHAEDGRRDVLQIPPGMLQVYRTLLRNRRGPILVYENPGRPKPVLFQTPDEQSFFWLDRP
jgi:hypothetical protein